MVRSEPFSLRGPYISTRSFRGATKWIGGHGTTLGGVVIDSGMFIYPDHYKLQIDAPLVTGNFDWAKSGKFPSFTTSTEEYRNLIYTETFGRAAYGVKLRIEVCYANLNSVDCVSL